MNDSSNYFNPLSDAELDLALFQQQTDGLKLFINLGGFGGSSTRTELAAGIVAIAANGLVHIGSDSRAFVDRAKQLIAVIASGCDPQENRPWKLCSDGGLWHNFC